MMESLQKVWDGISYYYMQVNHMNMVTFFLLCAVIFMPLALLWPSRPSQPLVHKGMIPDILYWFFAGFIYGPARAFMISVVVALGIYSATSLNLLAYQGVGPLSKLPLLVQAALILFIRDFIQYWTHRMFHTNLFWKFHAIHHSPPNVDWLTSVRFHPVNVLVHSTAVGLFVMLLGFSPEAWAIFLPIDTLYSPLVHANVNWTYGPFRYLLASPNFHRWHHTYLNEGGNKNFAATFPFLDVLFGTYYDPRGVRPEVFGTEHDHISDENIVHQLIYPFMPRPKVKKEVAEAEMREADEKAASQ